MNERIFKRLTMGGVTSLVVGIVTLTAGVASGVLLIVNGSILLHSRKDLLI